MVSFIFILILTIPAIIFSILSWRLRTKVTFWLGVIFTALLALCYIFNLPFFISLVLNPDSFLYGLVFLLTLAIPVYFLVSSKLKKTDNGDSEITDDYLTKIIESDEEDIDFEK